MTDDFGGETMTMVERDGGAHPWSMSQEQSDYTLFA
jgi:hypothetical protein